LMRNLQDYFAWQRIRDLSWKNRRRAMADIEGIKDLFMKVVDNAKDVMVPEDAAMVRKNAESINRIIGVVIDVFADGLQLEDATSIGRVVAPLMKLAAGFKDYKGLEKKRFVVEVVWLVYRAVDTYPDGNRNNINIPFVMGGIERKVERGLVSFAAGMAVDALYRRMKKDDEV